MEQQDKLYDVWWQDRAEREQQMEDTILACSISPNGLTGTAW